MLKIWANALLLSLLCVLGGYTCLAQDRNAALAGGHTEDRLRMVIIVSRHGVRSPTWAQDRLDAYSALPWPAWSVQPGYLTPRGYELMKLFGAYDRAALLQEGLFTAQGCSAAASTYIWADIDERTVASGHALADGLFPGCSAEVHSLAGADNDPIFHPAAGDDPGDADRAFAELSKRAETLNTPKFNELLMQMQRVLDGCDPDRDCTPEKPPKIRMMDEKSGVTHGKGDKPAGFQGPMAQAASFAEDFLLEYSEGMPMQSVGWGRVNEAQIVRFLTLHTAVFDLTHRTPVIAKAEASNLLNHIVQTLQQGVDGKPVAGAMGDPGTKLVVLAGHDTNIGPLSALLGLHWNLDGRADDTPPGTELTFELWQSPRGDYQIRVSITMQTIHQLREAQTLTLANPPAKLIVTPAGCDARSKSCSWKEFLEVASAATRTP